MDAEQSTSYPTEFLNSLEISAVPSHKLQLKLNVPVTPMRNLDAPRPCNRTRLRITQLGQNILGAIILTSVGKVLSYLKIQSFPMTYRLSLNELSFRINSVFLLPLTKRKGKHFKWQGYTW
jgi:PIF1 helicase.